MYSMFPVRSPRAAARCKHCFVLCPGLSQKDMTRTKEIAKERHIHPMKEGVGAGDKGYGDRARYDAT